MFVIALYIFLIVSLTGRLFPSYLPLGFADAFSFVSLLAIPFLAICLVVFLPIAVIAKIIGRAENPDSKKLSNSVMHSSLVAILWLIGVWCIPAGLPSGSYQLKFDEAEWKKPEASKFTLEISARERMLGDLIENVLPGKSREEIEQLLGPSLETPYFQSVDKHLIYYMGRQRGSGINIDSEWLLIWLNEEEIFERHAIYND
jgi:hypothetical protein